MVKDLTCWLWIKNLATRLIRLYRLNHEIPTWLIESKLWFRMHLSFCLLESQPASSTRLEFLARVFFLTWHITPATIRKLPFGSVLTFSAHHRIVAPNCLTRLWCRHKTRNQKLKDPELQLKIILFNFFFKRVIN